MHDPIDWGSHLGRGSVISHRHVLTRPLLAIVLVCALLLGGCSKLRPDEESSRGPHDSPAQPPEGEPPADKTVAALAKALTNGSLKGIGFVGDPATAQQEASDDLETIMAGMDGLLPRVKAGTITYRGGGSATAVLHQTWKIGAGQWTYDSQARMNLVQGTWKISWASSIVHPDLASAMRLRHTREMPNRAPILDREGKALMEVVDTFQIGIDKANLSSDKWMSSAQALAKKLDMDVKKYQAAVKANGPKAFVIATTVRSNQVPDGVLDIPGVITVAGKQTRALQPRLAQNVLGTVGDADQTAVKKSRGRLQLGDPVGISGLPVSYTHLTLPTTPYV